MQKLLLGSIVGGLAGVLIGIVFALGSLLASDVLRAEPAMVIELCGGVAGLVGMFIGALSGATVAARGGSTNECIAAVGLGFMSGAVVAPCIGLAEAGGAQLLYAAGGAMAAAFVMIWHGRWRQPIKLPTAGSGWRGWLQFRLSTLLAMLVLTSALLGMLVSRPVAQRRAVAAIA
jgi:hypothetical protein